LFVNIYSFVHQGRIIVGYNGKITRGNQLYMAEGKKKSRIKKGKVGNSNARSEPVTKTTNEETTNEGASLTSMDFVADTLNMNDDMSNRIKAETSKLPPLQGTAGAKQLEASKKSYIEELFEPTPAGKEPKSVSLMKSVTWGAVIVLVLIEIFVSIKEGGAPFDFGKVSLPTLPSLPWLNGN